MIGTVDSDAGKEGERRRGRRAREDVSAKPRVAPRFSCGERKGITGGQFGFLKYGGNTARRG